MLAYSAFSPRTLRHSREPLVVEDMVLLSIAIPISLLCILAFQPSRLSIHIFDDDVADFAQSGTIFQDIPRLIGVKMYFDEFAISNRYQTITPKIFHKILSDFVLIQPFSLDEQLCIISKFNHLHSFLIDLLCLKNEDL